MWGMGVALKGKKVLLVGCGDIGNCLGILLIRKGAQVWGLRREPSGVKAPIQPLQADVTDDQSLEVLNPLSFDYVVVTLTANHFSDNAYRITYVHGLRNILAALIKKQFSGHLFFVSSTSVYHQRDGQWVDEQSPTMPVSFAGLRMLEAEELANNCSISATILRFSGIYGPGRHRLIKQVLALQSCPDHPPLYTNRIHRDDCVGVLVHLIDQHCRGNAIDTLYIGTDSQPATLHSVIAWLAQQLGVDSDAMRSVKSQRNNSKRCSNRRLLASGYQLRYPDYQSGYQKLVENER